MILKPFALLPLLSKDPAQHIYFRLMRQLFQLLLLFLFLIFSPYFQCIEILLLDFVLVVETHGDLLVDSADLCPGHASTGQWRLLETLHFLLVVELDIGCPLGLIIACVAVTLLIRLHPSGLSYVPNAVEWSILGQFSHSFLREYLNLVIKLESLCLDFPWLRLPLEQILIIVFIVVVG